MGSYVYEWPEKYDQVFFPVTDGQGLWACASGFVGVIGDIELSIPEKERIEEYLDKLSAVEKNSNDAAAKLRRYIAAFEAAFPDSRRVAQREELDRMLKERLASRLKRNKTTLVEADIEAVLIELPAVGTPMPAKRRLFRIRQGRDIAGVCLGVAAYSQLDVGLVRSIFVLAAGVSIIFYLIAMFVVPVVETVEQAKLASASS